MSRPTRRSLTLIAAALVGVAIGTGGYTFSYGQGASYMKNDPAVCANCHVMAGHLSGWLQSSHKNVATCNDCHAPHDLLGKYWTKARNGWNHSVAFTTGDFPEVLRITEANREVTEGACRYCHTADAVTVDGALPGHEAEPRSCLTCHNDVGHRSGPPILGTTFSSVNPNE